MRELLQGPIFNLPNAISMARPLFFLPILWVSYAYLADPESLPLLFTLLTLLALAGLSDFLDGFLARRLNQCTPLGQFLDPVSDKLILSGIVVLLYWHYSFPLYVLLLYGMRELLAVSSGLYLYYRKKLQGRPNFWGKSGVALLFIASLWYIAGPHLSTRLPFGHILQFPELIAFAIAVVYIAGTISYFLHYWQFRRQNHSTPV